ncbi:hypothetical protein [Marinoscillum furvescens]|uniref:DUF4249 family protein n=1 Tax=Marinoscillum furvescens DSM 4134 TaxID=1122208 RepID=A0A3D9L3R8_MARFU|nr:hypothetical protein [Marinoscillum furvescens]RED99450.1 hypothetical protein C7460_10866 [Marinoscillum furvescens DSM 4134]
MKTLLKPLSLLAVIALLMMSCQQDVPDAPEGELVTMKLNLSDELKTRDIPFSDGRVASATEYTVYGIQVNTVTNTGTQPYAHGVFDDTTGFEISVISGNTYEVSATAFQKGTGFGLYSSSNYDGSIYFSSPFYRELTNSFDYQNNSSISIYDSYTSTFTKSDSSSVAWHQRPEIDRYLSQYDQFIGAESTTLDVDLYRANFGVQIYADSLNEGKLVVNLQSAPSIELTTSNTFSDLKILQFRNLWNLQNAPDNYEEYVYTTIFHEKVVNGDTVTNPIYDNSILFKRNFIKQIYVTVPSEGSGGSAGLNLRLEDVQFQYDSLFIGG